MKAQRLDDHFRTFTGLNTFHGADTNLFERRVTELSAVHFIRGAAFSHVAYPAFSLALGHAFRPEPVPGIGPEVIRNDGAELLDGGLVDPEHREVGGDHHRFSQPGISRKHPLSAFAALREAFTNSSERRYFCTSVFRSPIFKALFNTVVNSPRRERNVCKKEPCKLRC